MLALATSCGLATLHFAGAGYPNSAGGVVGLMLGGGLEKAMSFLGATLLLLAVWLGSVSLAPGCRGCASWTASACGSSKASRYLREQLSSDATSASAGK